MARPTAPAEMDREQRGSDRRTAPQPGPSSPAGPAGTSATTVTDASTGVAVALRKEEAPDGRAAQRGSRVAGLGPQHILALQQTAGNAATAGLLGSSRHTPSRPPEAPRPQAAPDPAALAADAAREPVAPAERGTPVGGARTAAEPGAAVSSAASANPPEYSAAVSLRAVAPPTPTLRLPSSAPTPQQRRALRAIAGAFEAAGARVDAGLVQALDSAEAALTAQLTTLDARTAQRVAHIQARAAVARARIVSEAAGAVGRVTQAAATRAEEVETWRTETVGSADAALQQRQATVLASGESRARQAQESAEQTAQTARNDALGRVEQARTLGESRAANANGDEEPIREAQAATARDLTRDTADKVSAAAEQTATGMRIQGAEVSRAMQELSGRLAQDLTGHRQGVVGHLTEQSTRSLTTLGGAAAEGGRTIGERREVTLAALDRTEADAIAAVRAQAAAQRREIVAAGQRTAEHLLASASEAKRQVCVQLEEVASASVSQPLDEDTIGALADRTTTHVGVAAEQVVAALVARAGEATGAVGAATTQAATQVDGAVGQAGEGLQEAGDQGATGIREAGGLTEELLATTVRQMRTSGEATLTTFTSALDQNISTAEIGLTDLQQRHEANLGTQAAELRTNTAEPTGTLASRIDTAQQRAAERASRSWLSNQLHDLWDAVSSPEFLIGLAVGLLVAVIIIASAGTATPFVVMAAGIAAGAAGAAAGTMTGNVRQGKQGWDVFDNVLRNSLIGGLAGGVAAGIFLFGSGLAAGLGLTGGAAVAAGIITLEVAAVVSNTAANVLSGRPWDENLLTAMLLAPILEWIGGRIPGLKARGPVETPEGPQGPRRPGTSGSDEPPTGPHPEEPPAPRPDDERPGPVPDEDNPSGGRRRPQESPEGVTDEDVHVEDLNEPARRPGEPDLDPAICFPLGTIVATCEDSMPIELVEAGSLVYAYDFGRREVVKRAVLGVTRGSTRRWADVRFADGETLRATPSHRFWVESAQEWISADHLLPGMTVLLRDGAVATVAWVSEAALEQPEATFNLSVEDAENYFVGTLEALVHNITRSRMTYLSRPGYQNYVLRNRQGKIYYSGMCGPEETVEGLERRHGANRNRFNAANGDRVEMRPGTREYGQARLVEHRVAVRNATIIGRDGENYRGNRQEPLAADKLPEYVEYEQVKRGCG